MHTINVNVVRGRSYENLSYNSFMSRKHPDLQDLNFINFVQMLRSQRLAISCHINHSFIHSLVFQSEFHLAVGQQRVGLSAQLNPLILGVELTDITEQFLRLCDQTKVFVKLCYHCSNSEGHSSPTGVLTACFSSASGANNIGLPVIALGQGASSYIEVFDSPGCNGTPNSGTFPFIQNRVLSKIVINGTPVTYAIPTTDTLADESGEYLFFKDTLN